MWDQIIELVARLSQFTPGVRDIIDIAIVSYIFYRLIMLIRGTRAEQLVKGLVVLLIAMVASEQIGLRTINWLLRGFMTIGLVAIPIVFQPELRKALEQLGRGKIFPKPLPNYEDDIYYVLEEMQKAIPVLVKKKIGALVILQRKTGLKDIIETGIIIEGIVTAELIINIFMPRSPLHDGAVIIRGNTIAAAGCFLPLTENPNLSKELGTRHRAGLGITEISDAVAIIISEETGVISMAYEGKLTRYLDQKTLRSNLINIYLADRKKKTAANIWRWRFAQNNDEEQ
ncbi:MAG: diadenylate cyclase CdaA [Dethiobacteria bacterium]|jgi:diadenylate cyclase